ncbi:MAG TPA: nuclear transport factor 2 family protein [Bacteroidia bacterium]|nr:nuclear transport factor 2 family protein [Bacteroidia bacterium]
MRTFSNLLSLIILFAAACSQSKSPTETAEYKEFTIKESNTTPTVDIKEYRLITTNKSADSADAIEILGLKRKLPLAMQRKDSLLFEKILSKNFTYRGEDEFYMNKNDYINNRIHATWTIDTVKYQNLVLQFFDETAILTYRNTLNGTDEKGVPDIEHYSWADVYTKENGIWKIRSIHEIDSKVEYPNK